MKIEELSVEQIERAVDDAMATRVEFDDDERDPSRSRKYRRFVGIVVAAAKEQASVGDMETAIICVVEAGVRVGFALRDIAAVDEGLKSVERAS